MSQLHVISLGAGVQSTTMALMAAHGEIEPMPDFAIFADTQAEPGPVYEHLRWLSSDNVLPFPVHTVSAGNLFSAVIDGAAGRSRVSNPPFYTVTKGETGLLRRSCTRDYKIAEIKRFARSIYEERYGPVTPGCIEQWLGISSDEHLRWTRSDVKYINLRYPFLERALGRPADGLWFSRNDCLKWLDRHGYPEPPKSACTFCPFRSNEQWRWLRDNDPAGWEQAVAVDHAIRAGLPGTNAEALYVHESGAPLDEADLSQPQEANLFINACDGMCGV